MDRNKRWYTLDNSSKIFPATTTKGRNNTFYLSAILNENINSDILKNAVNDVLKRFPSFCVKLRRGVFWYYLEENNKPFKVFEGDCNSFSFFNENENNDYLFRVSVYLNKITITFFHAITDGNGGMEFFRAILFEYLKLLEYPVERENIIKSLESPALNSETVDNSVCISKSTCGKVAKDKRAFKTYGTPFEYDGFGIIIGSVKTEDLKKITKPLGVTITTYLATVLIHSIYLSFIKNKSLEGKVNKNVVAFIPANMRKIFGGDTLRNFLGYVRLCHDYNNPITFEELLESCKEQMNDKFQNEKMRALINQNVKIEKNILLRVMPLFIKDIAIKLAYSMSGDCLHTCNLSNLGNIDIPASMKRYIRDLYFIIDVGDVVKTNVSVLGYDEHINICFSRFFKETELERLFFKHFSNLGIKVKIVSNYWEKRI